FDDVEFLELRNCRKWKFVEKFSGVELNVTRNQLLCNFEEFLHRINPCSIGSFSLWSGKGDNQFLLFRSLVRILKTTPEVHVRFTEAAIERYRLHDVNFWSFLQPISESFSIETFDLRLVPCLGCR